MTEDNKSKITKIYLYNSNTSYPYIFKPTHILEAAKKHSCKNEYQYITSKAKYRIAMSQNTTPILMSKLQYDKNISQDKYCIKQLQYIYTTNKK